MLMGRKLNLTPALAQCILNNMTVDNGDYMYDLHSWTTAGSLKLYASLKIMRIVYARLMGEENKSIIGNIDGDAFVAALISHSQGICYEDSDSVYDGFEEMRSISWNPDRESTEINLTDAVRKLSNDAELSDAIEELQSESACDADAYSMYAEDEKLSFFNDHLDSINPADRKAVAELFADFWKDWCDEAEFFDGFYLCIRKLPWIYKALQLANEGIISKESTEVIRDEIDWLVDRCFYYQGQHGIYCLECTLTVEDAYVHYPNLFTPLRLTILESVAEKLCKSAESFTKLSADGKEKNAKTKNAKGSE